MLWRRYIRTRAIDDRNELVRRHWRLAEIFAAKQAAKLPNWIDAGELLGAAGEGLMRAVERFQPSRGLKFNSYAPNRVRGAIVDYLRELDSMPRSVRQALRQADEATREFADNFGRAPTDEELAEWAPALALAKARFPTTSSLDAACDGPLFDRPARRGDELADPRGELPDEAERRREFWRQALRGLRQEQRILMLGYYVEGKNMKEIGRDLGLSESRVSQMHAQIIQWMRERGGVASFER